MKKYFVISGLRLRDNNRGTAALGYGAFSFLREKGYIDDSSRMLSLMSRGRPFRKKSQRQVEGRDFIEKISVSGRVYYQETVMIPWWQWAIYKICGITLPLTKFRRVIKNISCVAAINGGDGFSDIYNTDFFKMRLPETLWAMRMKVPLILLPQTIGPFGNQDNLALAEKILKYASHVFVRDDNFNAELDRMGVKYERTNDLSRYMNPEPWDIEIDTANAVGINVSGLAYSNAFRSLSGQFSTYRELMNCIIESFQKLGKTVYLIPHSYRFGEPEKNNDDIEACRLAYERLKDKRNVVFVNKDLISPQIKYLISRMSFFCGTRMHANYAAIFTGVPVFGLAYSYKFEGAFVRNGLHDRVVRIDNLPVDSVCDVVRKVLDAYESDVMRRKI